MIHTWRSTETDPFARGRDLGSTWASSVHATLTEYTEMFERIAVPPGAVREISESSRSLVAEHAPEILAEIDGVAAGAGIEPWQSMVLNARTEIMTQAPADPPGECSTAVFVPTDGSTPRTLQTWDWYTQMAHETLVRSIPAAGDARLVTFGEFGQVAKIGVSTRGVGVHFNILEHVTDGSAPGVPVHVVTRMILDRASSLDDALAIVDAVPLAASTVLTVITHDGAACVELSPAGWAALPATPGTTLVHTNHFLDPELAAGGVVSARSTTHRRIAFLENHRSAVETLDAFARVQALASDEPGSINCDPDPARPPWDRPETKATFTIDVDRAELGFAPSHPRNITQRDWRTLAA